MLSPSIFRRTDLRNFRLPFLFFLALAVFCPGCSRAQVPQAQKDLDRRIEILVRGEMSVPVEYTITTGQRSKSEFTGYDKLPVTFAHNSAKRTIDFLISTDNKTLIRMDRMDLSKDPATAVTVKDRPFRGGADAKVTVVNFDDLECPFCARMHRELFPETIARYGDKVKIVYKDFPLVEIHPWALHAAVDANCLAQQNGDAYWDFVDQAHDRSQEISGTQEARKSQSESDAALDKLALEQGTKHSLKDAALRTCLSAQDTSAVKASMAQATELGVEATPTLYINGERVSGAEGTDVLWAVIDRALLDAGVQPPAAPVVTPPASTKPQGQ
jgi:protein-disulfide isomerase